MFYEVVCESEKKRVIRVYVPPISGSLSGHCSSYYELQKRFKKGWKKIQVGERGAILREFQGVQS